MQFNIEEVSPSKRRIKITLEPEEVGQIETQVVRKYQKEVQVPGFRRGKAPVGIIRKRYEESIKLDVIEEAISRFYGRVLDESKLNPISQGKVTDIQFEDVQKGMEIQVEVEVEPEIELKKYKGLKVEKDMVIVTEAMVQKVLEDLQEHFAIARDVDESKEGHWITFDIQQLGEGDVPIVGRKYENVTVRIGSGDFDPELEKQLIGVKVDQKVVVRRTVQPPEGAEDQAPRVESYEITVKAIQEKEYPELNDDLVKELNEENIDTLEDLKVAIRKNLQRELEERSRREFIDRLILEVLKENPFEVPEGMVEHYLDHIIDDLKRQSDDQPIDEAAIREAYRPEAIQRVRWIIIKNKIIEIENLSVSEEEIDEAIDKLEIPEDQREQLRQIDAYRWQLAHDLLDEKVIRLLEQHAEIIEVKPKWIKEEYASVSAEPEKKKSKKSGTKSRKGKNQNKGKDDSET
ncbi:MAG: trigger factor [Calditrichaeota bacterium]|nr:trigger factor [Calditrichota bacterium]